MRPAKRAVVSLARGVSLSYGELDRLVRVAAAWLGPRPGERIAFLGRNSIELLVLSYAAGRVGAIFVPLNWRLAPSEIDALLVDCTPSLVITDDEFAAATPGAMATTEFGAMLTGEACPSGAPADENQPLILLYTSGTTGKPKGVIVTGGNALYAALNFAAVGEVGADAVCFSDLPMFHTIGLIAVARTTLLQGGTLVLTDRFAPGRTLAALADESLGITHYFAVPVMLEALERDQAFAPRALRHLHAIFLGGSPLPPALAMRFLERGVPLVNGYGMSEAGTAIHVPIDREAVRRADGAVGVPAPHIEVRLVADGHDVADGGVGEVWLRGPSVTPGYWNQAAETSAAFSDGWFRTGDLARREPTGYYRIVDRLKDMFVSGGENVYPAEIENLLATHPDIADVAVLGVPDARWGESGVAFVVLRSGAELDDESLISWCASRIARFKCPTRFISVDSIPRSAAGKILKPLLRAQITSGDVK